MRLMMNTEGLSSCDSYTIDGGENTLKISQNNLFQDVRSSKKQSPNPSDREAGLSKQVPTGAHSPDPQHIDLVFATEVETSFNRHGSKESTQKQKQVMDYKLAKSI